MLLLPFVVIKNHNLKMEFYKINSYAFLVWFRTRYIFSLNPILVHPKRKTKSRTFQHKAGLSRLTKRVVLCLISLTYKVIK